MKDASGCMMADAGQSGGSSSDRPTESPPCSPEEYASRVWAHLNAAEGSEQLQPGPSSRPTPLVPDAASFDMDEDELIPAFEPKTDKRMSLPSVPEIPSLVVLPKPGEETMRERFSSGDFQGAKVVAEGLLAENPGHGEAREIRDTCERILATHAEQQIGSDRAIPAVIISPEQIRWLDLDHRAGFVLSCIDGGTTVEDIVDLAGMPRLDVLMILYDLIQVGAITLLSR